VLVPVDDLPAAISLHRIDIPGRQIEGDDAILRSKPQAELPALTLPQRRLRQSQPGVPIHRHVQRGLERDQRRTVRLSGTDRHVLAAIRERIQVPQRRLVQPVVGLGDLQQVRGVTPVRPAERLKVETLLKRLDADPRPANDRVKGLQLRRDRDPQIADQLLTVEVGVEQLQLEALRQQVRAEHREDAELVLRQRQQGKSGESSPQHHHPSFAAGRGPLGPGR
jgi:hypothetical protein